MSPPLAGAVLSEQNAPAEAESSTKRLSAPIGMGLLDFAVFSIAFLPLAVRVELGLDGLILDVGYLLDWRWWACVGGIGCLYGLRLHLEFSFQIRGAE